METNETEYEVIFKSAKNSTVYAHAMVWIRAALEDEKTDRYQFEEIKKIIDIAVNHLSN